MYFVETLSSVSKHPAPQRHRSYSSLYRNSTKCFQSQSLSLIPIIFSIYRNSTHCDQTQSLSISEEDGSTLVNWTCNDNTYTISQPLQSTENYILVNLSNTMTEDGGRFWIGFQGIVFF